MIATLIILLYLAGFIGTESAIISLSIAGVLLCIAELGVVSFGLIALNGVIALYAGYSLQMGDSALFGIDIGWPVLFGIAFVECIMLFAVISVHIRMKRQKITTGTEGMIGQKATIISWNETKGSVRFEGEIWTAKSVHNFNFTADDEVTVTAVDKLNLTITA